MFRVISKAAAIGFALPLLTLGVAAVREWQVWPDWLQDGVLYVWPSAIWLMTLEGAHGVRDQIFVIGLSATVNAVLYAVIAGVFYQVVASIRKWNHA